MAKNFKKRTPTGSIDPLGRHPAPFYPQNQPRYQHERGEETASERQDVYIDCIDCGKPFLFTAGEQEYFKMHDLHQPKRCLPCRGIRKQQVASENA